MGLRSARAPLLALVLLVVGAARGDAEEPPAFLVERIVVEGLARPSAQQIVVSESLLRAGNSYSEGELRAAVYRVKRLLWVVDADMALRRGSTRGAYELVIVVEAAKPVAFSVNAGGLYSRPDAEEDDGGYDGLDFGASLTASGRKFIGSRGLLFGSAQAFDNDVGTVALQLGYTTYGLFGNGSSATAAISRGVGDRYDDDNLQASLQLDIPLGGNHALRTSATWSTAEGRTEFFGGFSESGFEQWRAELEWLYDSTDDPLFATAGRRLNTLAVYEDARRHFRFVRDDLGDGGLDSDERFDRRAWGLDTQGRQYWSLTPQQSLGVGAGVFHVDDLELDGSATSLNVEAIHAVNLWDFATRRRRGDLRLETVAAVRSWRYSGGVGARETIDGRLDLSLLFRNAWGVIRLTFTYYDSLGEDR
jgi:outer membrane protein assembly factor BamA